MRYGELFDVRGRVASVVCLFILSFSFVIVYV